jgi:alpha-tubulin suppressor-like RCC1 family protein
MTNRPAPVVVSVPGGVSAVARGDRHTCAINAAGDVYCWGNIEFADGAHTTPTNVVLPAAADLLSGYQGSCARLVTGAVMCWGRGRDGANGDGTFTEEMPMPSGVSGVDGATAIARGTGGGCAIAAGQLHCWGFYATLTDPAARGMTAQPIALSCPP